MDPGRTHVMVLDAGGAAADGSQLQATMTSLVVGVGEPLSSRATTRTHVVDGGLSTW